MFDNPTRPKTWVETTKLIYGPAKSGKSTLASSMTIGRKPLAIIDTENGYVGIPNSKVETVRTWEEFVSLKNKLVKFRSDLLKKYCGICVDLISDLDIMCTKFICEQRSVKTLADVPYGGGWKLQRDEFQAHHDDLFMNFPMNFVCHDTEKMITLEGKELRPFTPFMDKAAWKYINGKVDTVVFIFSNVESGKPYTAMIRPSDVANCGSRYKSIVGEYKFHSNKPEELIKQIEERYNVKPEPSTEA